MNRLRRERILVMGMLGGDKFAYRKLWLHTIHVATTGNDTTGNGSLATPYLTLTKAMTVAVAGDGILVADGTYAENTGASGAWKIEKNLANWLIIEPEKGASGNVTITGTTGYAGYNIVFAPSTTSQYIKFRFFNFGMSAQATTGIMVSQATTNYLSFESCKFTPITNAQYGFAINIGNNIQLKNCTFLSSEATTIYQAIRTTLKTGVSNLLLDDCIINAPLTSTGYGVYLITNGDMNGSMTVNNCTINAGVPISLTSGGVLTVTNSTFNESYGTLIGVDGTPATVGGDLNTTAILQNCTINKDPAQIGHALLFGAGCVDCVADNITISQAYDYALVSKENTSIEIKNCHLTGGSTSALLYKASISSNAHDNVLVGTGAAGAFQIRNGDNPAHKCATWLFQNNIINVTNGKALSIGNSDHDSGGGVCDYNQYQNNSGLGVVRNDPNVQSLAELQAAWADYDVTTNDAHSTVV